MRTLSWPAFISSNMTTFLVISSSVSYPCRADYVLFPECSLLRLKFFLDEGVPDSVAVVLRESGHDATVLRESGVPTGSPDQVVATFAEVSESILVALDGDMKRIARGNGVNPSRFGRLNLLKLSCPEPMAVSRLKEAMSLIEHEWTINQGQRSRRLFVEIGINVMRTCR